MCYFTFYSCVAKIVMHYYDRKTTCCCSFWYYLIIKDPGFYNKTILKIQQESILQEHIHIYMYCSLIQSAVIGYIYINVWIHTHLE